MLDVDYGDGTVLSDDTGGAHHARLAGVYVNPNGRTNGRPYPIAPSPDTPLAYYSSRISYECQFGSWHAGGSCGFVMVDGSVHRLMPDIDDIILGYLANRNDGMTIDPADLSF